MLEYIGSGDDFFGVLFFFFGIGNSLGDELEKDEAERPGMPSCSSVQSSGVAHASGLAADI